MGDVVMQRGFKPWIQPDFLFHLSPLANVQKQCLAVLHNMTDSVIQSRKRQLLQTRKDGATKEENADIGKHNSTDKTLLALISSKPSNHVTQSTHNRIRKKLFPTYQLSMRPQKYIQHVKRQFIAGHRCLYQTSVSIWLNSL
jgi:hypothetical protein